MSQTDRQMTCPLLGMNYIKKANHSICSNNLFFALQYFSLFKLKVFSNKLSLVCLSFHVMKVIPDRLP